MGAIANAQNDHLRILAAETRADSHSVKVLTFVTTIYLPANLIAVSPQAIEYQILLCIAANEAVIVRLFFRQVSLKFLE